MKKILTLACTLLFTAAVFAQVKTPAPSPSQKVEQKVGLTDISVEYSRPSMKGRTIFGGLVPYDNLWRTGANRNTMITFGDDVKIGGKDLKAGTYAIFTKPGMKNWEVFFYTDYNNWGTPQEWDTSKIAAQVRVPVIPIPMDIETFTITFDDLTHNKANLGIMWEKAYVGVPIEVHTDKMVTASIEQVMGGPSDRDYYSAAVYYLEADKDINKAKMWIDKAIEMRPQPAFWYHRQQSFIYAKAGDKKGAVTAAKRSLELAKKAGNDDYVALNTKSLKEWGAM